MNTGTIELDCTLSSIGKLMMPIIPIIPHNIVRQ